MVEDAGLQHARRIIATPVEERDHSKAKASDVAAGFMRQRIKHLQDGGVVWLRAEEKASMYTIRRPRRATKGESSAMWTIFRVNNVDLKSTTRSTMMISNNYMAFTRRSEAQPKRQENAQKRAPGVCARPPG